MTEIWRFDPDNRIDHSNGPIDTRQMTAEEWARYGPRSNTQQRSFLLRDSDIARVLRRRLAV